MANRNQIQMAIVSTKSLVGHIVRHEPSDIYQVNSWTKNMGDE